MNTKQLTALWYGTLAASFGLFSDGGPWTATVGIALITGVLIYTLGPVHSANIKRVAAALAAPFVLVGLIVSGLLGYRSWQNAAAADALKVETIQVTRISDCPTDADERSTLPLPRCHMIEGTIQNRSGFEIADVSINAFVTDSAGESRRASVGVSYLPRGQDSFTERVRLPRATHRVDSAVVEEVNVSGSDWPF